MIIFVGGIVGVIVISMYLPLFTSTTRFSSAPAARPISGPRASGALMRFVTWSGAIGR